MSQIIDVATEAARCAGGIIRGYFAKDIEIRNKTSNELISDADLEAEQAIISCIRKTFPEHCFLAEESNQEVSTDGPLWIIDPLDGTTNFLYRIPHFATSIAFYDKGELKAGVVYNPVREDLFQAERGSGALYNGQQSKSSQAAELSQSLIATGFHYERGEVMENTLSAMRELFLRQIRGIRRMGTASLDLCYVGCGRFDAFFELVLSPWDYAAGALFVEEAGGRISDSLGQPLVPSRKSGVLAANPRLYPQILAATKSYAAVKEG